MKHLSTARRSAALIVLFAAPLQAAPADGDWPNYGRTAGGDRHSPLTQITRDNVAQLTLAWEYKTGEAQIATGLLKPVLEDWNEGAWWPVSIVYPQHRQPTAKIRAFVDFVAGLFPQQH